MKLVCISFQNFILHFQFSIRACTTYENWTILRAVKFCHTHIQFKPLYDSIALSSYKVSNQQKMKLYTMLRGKTSAHFWPKSSGRSAHSGAQLHAACVQTIQACSNPSTNLLAFDNYVPCQISHVSSQNLNDYIIFTIYIQ